jgi:hypothetical protein
MLESMRTVFKSMIIQLGTLKEFHDRMARSLKSLDARKLHKRHADRCREMIKQLKEVTGE